MSSQRIAPRMGETTTDYFRRLHDEGAKYYESRETPFANLVMNFLEVLREEQFNINGFIVGTPGSRATLDVIIDESGRPVVAALQCTANCVQGAFDEMEALSQALGPEPLLLVMERANNEMLTARDALDFNSGIATTGPAIKRD